MAHGQSHHGGKTASHVFNRLELRMLDGIGAGFIKRIAGLDVGLDLCVP